MERLTDTLSSCSVEEEHGQVSRELDRLPRQADMEARVANLNRQLEELRDEIRKVCISVPPTECGAGISLALSVPKTCTTTLLR